MSTVDPQATFYAAALGCPVRVAAPAHSRAGWPTATARAHALAASAGALRVAARLGVAGRYAPGLAAQARRAWLPPLSTNPAAGDLSARVNRVNLKLVAAGLDPATRDTVRAALPTPAPAVPDTELSLLLLVVDAAVASPDPARMAEIRAQMSGWTGAGTGSMLAVAALALAGRLFAVPQWTSQAVALAGPLRRPTGGYTLGGPAGTPASLTASAIGAWLVPPDTNPVSGWVRVGLCTAHRCAESVAILSTVDYLSWRVAAQLLAGQQGAYQDLFPVSF